MRLRLSKLDANRLYIHLDTIHLYENRIRITASAERISGDATESEYSITGRANRKLQSDINEISSRWFGTYNTSPKKKKIIIIDRLQMYFYYARIVLNFFSQKSNEIIVLERHRDIV